MFNFLKRKKAKNTPRPRIQSRGYEAALVNRLTNSWTTTSRTADEELRADLKTLRARSRDMVRNNDYARRFMHLLGTNVVGPNGIGLQVKAKRVKADGTEKQDPAANKKIESGWARWCRPENASVTRRMSFRDIQRLFIQSVARDGEVLIRKRRNFNNPFRFALQALEPDHLDMDYDVTELANGNRIKMGVELDPWGAPDAYHVLTNHPGENIFYMKGRYRERIPADEIIHAFIVERPGQTRAAPWMAASMTHLMHAYRYQESEEVAARIGAAKMGFITSQDSEGYAGDDEDDGDLVTEVRPGSFEQLPEGMSVETFDPDHPNTAFSDFMKSVLRGAAAGLNVSYNSLSSDLEGVNYSSIRQGVLEDRDNWMLLQAWMIDSFMVPVFETWLEMAILSGQVSLPMTSFDLYNAPVWKPKRWGWVDPLKDMNANIVAIENGLKSRADVIADQGGDIDDTFEALATEDKKAKALKLNLKNGGNGNAKQT